MTKFLADEIAASPFDSDVAFQREQFVYLRSMAARCKDESVRRVNRLLPVGKRKL